MWSRARCLAGIGAVLVAGVGCSASTPSRPPVAAAAGGFHIEYDVTDGGGSRSREVTDVVRPYRARTLRYADAASLGGAVWTEQGLYTVSSSGAVQQASVAWPAPPGPDSHLDIALPVALRQGLVRRGAGVDTVLGRPCWLWLSMRPLDGADFALPSSNEQTTSCVSAEGLILRDDWRKGGTALRARVAVVVGGAPPLSEAELLGAAPTPLPNELSSYSVTPSTQAELARLIPVPEPPAPAGLQPDKAVAVLDIDRSGRAPAVEREGAVLSWAGGGHLVAAKYSRNLLGPTSPPLGGAPVSLGRLGTGRLTPVLTGLRVDVLSPGGLLLTVRSDLPEAQLLSWMRALAWST